MATAATTALSATNHTASDPSHAGSDDGHHHATAIVAKLGGILLRSFPALHCCSRGRERLDSKEALPLRQTSCGGSSTHGWSLNRPQLTRFLVEK